MSGRKRHLLVDTLGLVLKAKVHAADLQDRAAVPLALEGATEEFPRLEHLWVDQGYTGAGKEWIEDYLRWSVEVVRHPPKPRGEWQPRGDLDGLGPYLVRPPDQGGVVRRCFEVQAAELCLKTIESETKCSVCS